MPLLKSSYLSVSLVFIGTFIFTMVAFRRLKRKKDRRKFPPSIGFMPILGSLPYLPDMSEMHRFCLEKSETLGDIISFSIGGRLMVVLNSKDAIHEAFIKKAAEFSDRPTFYFNRYMNPNYKGVSDCNFTPEFKKYHRLSLSILKRFGFGQNLMEERIKVEVRDFVKRIQDLGGAPVDPKDLVQSSVLNIISGILFGRRYEHADSEAVTICNCIHHLVHDATPLVTLDFFPFLRFIPPFSHSIRKVVHATREMARLTEETINKVSLAKAIMKKGPEEEQQLYDSFIEAFIDIEGEGYDKEQLIFIVRDFIIAGTETVSSTLLWAMITLANKQDVQSRLYNEIIGVVSNNREALLSDRQNLPYTEAFTLELMRRRTLAVLGAPHCNYSDTTLCGFFIPSHTMIIPNLYAVHMNSKVWKNSEDFRPERFLDETETTVINKDLIMPFSIGRRACMGELLARQEIFLFITTLVLHYHILPPEGQKIIQVEEIISTALTPSPFNIRLLPRV